MRRRLIIKLQSLAFPYWTPARLILYLLSKYCHLDIVSPLQYIRNIDFSIYNLLRHGIFINYSFVSASPCTFFFHSGLSALTICLPSLSLIFLPHCFPLTFIMYLLSSSCTILPYHIPSTLIMRLTFRSQCFHGYTESGGCQAFPPAGKHFTQHK